MPDRAFEPLGANAAAYGAAHPDADLPRAPAADLFAAIRLGLRLEPRKEQVEVVVIDHIESVSQLRTNLRPNKAPAARVAQETR